METLRVDIAYRPLRIAWAIQSDDHEAFRRAVRLNHTLWGGRFNPIIFADRPIAGELVKLFRADFIMPIGDGPEVKALQRAFPERISPIRPTVLFFRPHQMPGRTDKVPGRARVLDMQNAFVHWRQQSLWDKLKERPIRRIVWDDADPLADVFLIEHGGYPQPADVADIDYWKALNEIGQFDAITEIAIDPAAPIPNEVAETVGPSTLSRTGLSRHYSVRGGWDFPGLFAGDATNLDDLAYFWNLRAADVPLRFIDPARLDRYSVVRSSYVAQLQTLVSGHDGPRGNIALWTRGPASQDLAQQVLPEGPGTICQLEDASWRFGAISPPTMTFGEETSLGVLGRKRERPGVSFAFNSKPFATDRWFHDQHLIASLNVRGPYDDHDHAFQLPYVPPLNEFYSRAMVVMHDNLHIEPERLGLVIDATTHDANLAALSNWDLICEIFERLCGLKPSLSSAGLIARQLMAQVGGLDGARPFKIPGVRRLLKTGGLRDSISWKAAMQLIGCDDSDNPGAHFKDHKDLYIEPRELGSALEPKAVFTYLVDKGLYRIGFDLDCPTCRLTSWVPLDDARQSAKCEMCGAPFDATRQLVAGTFAYRRSGVLGREKNAQGAIPVILVLQQLATNLSLDWVFLPSIDLKPAVGDKWEIDFLVIGDRTRMGSPRTEVLIGEVKDRGYGIDENDIANLRKTAEAFPNEFFDVYIVLAKLASFTEAELALAATLNERGGPRVIILTDRELEPYMLYERTETELGLKDLHTGSPEELALATQRIYPELRPKPLENPDAD